MRRGGDGPRRRRVIRGTIARIGELAMRYGHLSQLATLDCTSSRRSTVMCALPRAIAVTTVYQRDSSSKRPRASVVFAARPPTRRWNATWQPRRPGLRARWAAPSAPLDTASATWSEVHVPASCRLLAIAKPSSTDRGLTESHSISATPLPSVFLRSFVPPCSALYRYLRSFPSTRDSGTFEERGQVFEAQP